MLSGIRIARGLILAAILLACEPAWTYAPQSGSARKPINVCLQAPDPTNQLTDAVRAWDRSMRNWRGVRKATTDCDVTVYEGPCSDPVALACADRLGGTSIALVPTHYEHDRTGILLHELGHIFGAQHLHGTLMSAQYYKHYSCPDLETVIQVAAYQHANLAYFSWCE